jgi:hypothetical protein
LLGPGPLSRACYTAAVLASAGLERRYHAAMGWGWQHAGGVAAGIFLALALAGTAAAKDEDVEHKFVLELGTSGEWPLNDERPNFGGTFAVEFEPIENWLELELGITTLNTTGHSDLSGDLLFKKPFKITPSFEFMIGAGPSVSQTLNGPDRGTKVSAEFALDFMFWPTKDVGWFFEPTYSINPRTGERSAAFSVGLLFGFQ